MARLRFSHVVARFSSSSLQLLCGILRYSHTTVFYSIQIEGHLDCFQLLAIMNKTLSSMISVGQGFEEGSAQQLWLGLWFGYSQRMAGKVAEIAGAGWASFSVSSLHLRASPWAIFGFFTVQQP